jgi:cation transport ATPase
MTAATYKTFAGQAPAAGKSATEKSTGKKPAAKHKLHVAHHTHGRVRMKIPSAKGNPEALRQIAESFGGVPGVESVEVNPTTGSLTLKYSASRQGEVHAHLGDRIGDAYQPPETEIDKLSDNIAREAEFLAEHSHTARMIVDFFILLDRELKQRSHNYVDLKIVLAALIIGGTMFELGMAAATPVWLTLAVFSVNHMVQLHQHQVKRDLAGAGAPA